MSAIFVVTAYPFAALVVVSGLFAVFGGQVEAYSALLGGLAVLIPNAVFARLALKHGGAQNARLIVNGFFLGEILKLCLVALWLGLVLVWVTPLSAAPLFIAFIAMQVSSVIAATYVKARLPTRRH